MSIQFPVKLSMPGKTGSLESKETDRYMELFCVYHQTLPVSMQNITEKTPYHYFKMIRGLSNTPTNLCIALYCIIST